MQIRRRRRRSRRVAWRRAIRLENPTIRGFFSPFFSPLLFFGERRGWRINYVIADHQVSLGNPPGSSGWSPIGVVRAAEVTREGESRDLRGPPRGTWEGRATREHTRARESTGFPSFCAAETSRMMFNWQRPLSARNGPLEFRLPGCLGSVRCHFDTGYVKHYGTSAFPVLSHCSKG